MEIWFLLWKSREVHLVGWDPYILLFTPLIFYLLFKKQTKKRTNKTIQEQIQQERKKKFLHRLIFNETTPSTFQVRRKNSTCKIPFVVLPQDVPVYVSPLPTRLFFFLLK